MNDGLLTGQAFSHTLSDTNMPSDKTYILLRNYRYSDIFCFWIYSLPRVRFMTVVYLSSLRLSSSISSYPPSWILVYKKEEKSIHPYYQAPDPG